MTNPPRKFNTQRLLRTAASEDLDYLLAGEPAQTVERAAERGLPLLHVALDAIAPDPQQLRRLPHPQTLQELAAAGDRAAATLLADLQALGASMRAHGQLQPAIVYADNDPAQPAIRYRLFHGQRRWSAALLATLPTLWVVEVPAPTAAARIVRQFDENERRASLNDMERAWALQALKAALEAESGPMAWGTVEQQFQLSEQRRQDLVRLMRFDAAGQDVLARYGWSEWIVRPLHQAIHTGALTPAAATAILQDLTHCDSVTTAVVATRLAAARTTQAAPATPAAPRPLDPAVQRATTRLQREIAQVRKYVPSVTDHAARQAVRAELTQLRAQLDAVLRDLEEPPPA